MKIEQFRNALCKLFAESADIPMREILDEFNCNVTYCVTVLQILEFDRSPTEFPPETDAECCSVAKRTAGSR